MGTPAIVLLSGGLDSATVAALAQRAGYTLHALTVLYGQRHAVEIQAAQRVASALQIRDHQLLSVDLHFLAISALTDSHAPIPHHRAPEQMATEIPSTYVPARNTILLSLALAWAESLSCEHIFIGVNAVDYSGYPDCRPEFLSAFEQLAKVATRAGVEHRWQLTIHAPLLQMSKADIIRTGVALGLDYGLTHSCYDPDQEGWACGTCDACQLRLAGFRQLGLSDPIPYQAAP